MKIPQVSVFVSNRPGRLQAVCRSLADAGVNLLSLTLADSGEFGLIRLIVSDPEKAVDVLAKAGLSATITDVVAYPNPVRPGYNGFVGIKGLVSNSLVRITTVDGTFVTQLISEGGQAVWDCTTINGEKVEPGVYLIFVSTKQGTDKFATKILIMN